MLTPEYAGLDPRAEALLYAASRAEHVARLVRPALARGAVVVTDRYIDSSVAYQGIGRGLGPDVIGEINLWATRSLLPDLTVLLDVEAGAGLAPDRLGARPHRAGARGVPRVGGQGFRGLAAGDPERYLVLARARRPRGDQRTRARARHRAAGARVHA